jgi:protein required for attachment to host cells
MTTTWVVVAHRAGARFFEHRNAHGIQHEVLELRELSHPEGRKKSGQIDTDRSGSTFTGQRGDTGSRAMGQEQTSHEHKAEVFAKSLAEELRKARNDHQFDNIVLVAEPHFCGLLDAALDAPTGKLVTERLHKDLAHVPSHGIYEHVRKALPL